MSTQPFKFSPVEGTPLKGSGASASAYRKAWPTTKWRYNPWTGTKRHSNDVKTDPYGHLIRPPVEPAPEAQDTITATLSERGKRYGKFTDHAKITQDLKAVMHGCPKWAALAPDQKEALEMTAHKIGRILNGDPDYDDSWVDIAGYTKLVADRLQRVER